LPDGLMCTLRLSVYTAQSMWLVGWPQIGAIARYRTTYVIALGFGLFEVGVESSLDDMLAEMAVRLSAERPRRPRQAPDRSPIVRRETAR
jgi:hypothetical protein